MNERYAVTPLDQLLALALRVVTRQEIPKVTVAPAPAGGAPEEKGASG